MSWNSGDSQEIRFWTLLKILPAQDTVCTLLDIGCGLGDLTATLKKAGHSKVQYTGLDLVPELTAGARKKYPQYNFQTGDFMAENFQETFDFLVLSGVLNIAVAEHPGHLTYIQKFIKKMYALSRQGCAFNLLSIHGKKYFIEDPNFYYADPDELFKYCKKICPQTTLETGYLNHDFTIFMRRPSV